MVKAKGRRKEEKTRGRNRFCPEVGVEVGVAQTMYTYVSKCKNDKIKKLHEQKHTFE
jgi:hypothetical protein